MRPWTRVERAEGREGVTAVIRVIPLAAVLVVGAALNRSSVLMTLLGCVGFAAMLGVGVHWQARRRRPIKRVYDLMSFVGLALLAGWFVVMLIR